MPADTDSERLLFERLVHARERWWYEEKLIHHRLSWFFSAQGLLGLGYAWLRYRVAEVLASPATVAEPDLYVGKLETLALFLLVLGVVVSLVTAWGIHAAATAQAVLKDEPEYKDFQLDVSAATTKNGMMLAYAMPLISCFAWLASLIFLRN